MSINNLVLIEEYLTNKFIIMQKIIFTLLVYAKYLNNLSLLQIFVLK